MLAHLEADVQSELPIILSGAGVLRKLGGEAGLNPLPFAAYSGDENVVSLVLNSPGGTVDQPPALNVFRHLLFRINVIEMFSNFYSIRDSQL